MKVLGAADPEVLVATAANPDVTVDALRQSGAIERFFMLNDGPCRKENCDMVRPASDPSIPWPALVVGLWIPNFFYWGLNQYITQRTLGSKSLGEGQKGVVFAAALKLIIPFIVVIPGILAFNLFSQDLRAEADKKNAPIIEQLDAGAEMLFRFNGQFADIHPELAARIVAHNQSWSEVEVVGESLVEQNEAVVVAVKETQPIPVSNLLAGYDFDAAFPTLLRRVVPQGNGILGFVLAAIFGAVVSSLASMLNSASTIFTMDIYHKVRKRASQSELVSVGRVCTLLFVLIAVCIAPNLGAPEFSDLHLYPRVSGLYQPGCVGNLCLWDSGAEGTSGGRYGRFIDESNFIWGVKDMGATDCLSKSHGDLYGCSPLGVSPDYLVASAQGARRVARERCDLARGFTRREMGWLGRGASHDSALYHILVVVLFVGYMDNLHTDFV